MGSAIMMISGLTDLQIWSTLPCGCCYHSPLPLCALPYSTFRHAVLVACQPRNKKKAHKFDPIHFFLQNPHNFTIHSLLEDVFTCHHVSAWQPGNLLSTWGVPRAYCYTHPSRRHRHPMRRIRSRSTSTRTIWQPATRKRPLRSSALRLES